MGTARNDNGFVSFSMPPQRRISMVRKSTDATEILSTVKDGRQEYAFCRRYNSGKGRTEWVFGDVREAPQVIAFLVLHLKEGLLHC